MSGISETLQGGCYLDHFLVHCAWEASECGALEYKTHANLNKGSERKKCSATHRSLIGMCVDEKLCTSDASNCVNPDKFVDQSPYCNIEYNRYPERFVSYALWGTCARNNGKSTCVWSGDDCPQSDTFTFSPTLVSPAISSKTGGLSRGRLTAVSVTPSH